MNIHRGRDRDLRRSRSPSSVRLDLTLEVLDNLESAQGKWPLGRRSASEQTGSPFWGSRRNHQNRGRRFGGGQRAEQSSPVQTTSERIREIEVQRLAMVRFASCPRGRHALFESVARRCSSKARRSCRISSSWAWRRTIAPPRDAGTSRIQCGGRMGCRAEP